MDKLQQTISQDYNSDGVNFNGIEVLAIAVIKDAIDEWFSLKRALTPTQRGRGSQFDKSGITRKNKMKKRMTELEHWFCSGNLWLEILDVDGAMFFNLLDDEYEFKKISIDTLLGFRRDKK